MKTLDVGHGRKAKLDDEHYEAAAKFIWHSWQTGERIWVARNRSHKVAKSGGKIYLQSVVLDLKPGDIVIFRNRDYLDFRPENLAIADRQAASARKSISRETFSSQYRGVSWNRTKEIWQVVMQDHNRLIWVGAYDEEEEAAQAYDDKALELYGEFATLNFPV
jgi:hypothetical protein